VLGPLFVLMFTAHILSVRHVYTRFNMSPDCLISMSVAPLAGIKISRLPTKTLNGDISQTKWR